MVPASFEVSVRGIRTFVSISGEGTPLLCLHGWGASHEAFMELRSALQGQPFQVIAPDLPGFGASDEPPEVWGVGEYADWVEGLVGELGTRNQEPGTRNHELGSKFQIPNSKFLLLGHSFGGRIAIKLAARNLPWIEHLYLCGAAGIRHRRHLKRTAGIALAEAGKLLFRLPGLHGMEGRARTLLYKALRVHDYEKTSGIMRATMLRVIAEDLTSLLSGITAPTDLFWGTHDRMTPFSDAQLMNKKIVHSVLHTYKGTGHRVHRDRAGEIAEVIRKRLGEELQ